MRHAPYQFRREIDSVEKGHLCKLNDDGSYTVISDTEHGKRYRVEAQEIAGMLRIKCDCESGEKRSRVFIPCWHGAQVARRLEREGKVRWQHGHWFMIDRKPYTGPADPFEGLPRARS